MVFAEELGAEAEKSQAALKKGTTKKKKNEGKRKEGVGSFVFTGVLRRSADLGSKTRFLSNFFGKSPGRARALKAGNA